MGISGQPETLINLDTVRREQIPVIKRFSGGGTVIVDENTLFITLILSKEFLAIPPFPESILRWTADLYTAAWQIPHFHLRENDYCIGDKKCGGNAQYIQKDRWLHHTSFLWDYAEENMHHLLLPAKRPSYRQDRPHAEFLTRLRSHVKSREELIENLKKTLTANVKPQYNTPTDEASFGDPGKLNVKPLYIRDFSLNSWEARPHRQTTRFLSL